MKHNKEFDNGVLEGKSLEQDFFKQMVLIRTVEEYILELFSKGLVTGTTHTCIGQEACAVGVVNALNKEKDIIFSNHRNHGHYLAYCDDVEGLLGEIMGKEVGVCGGIGGSQHIHRGNFFSSGIQGGLVPSATGAAFAEKLKKTDAIVVSFLGDGTLGQGVVYECLNIASLWSLPILYVVEDNKYAQSTPSHVQHAGRLVDRASPFQIESRELEVENVIGVYQIARKAVKLVRREKRPYFLVLHTYRLVPHSKGDDYRSKEEIEAHRAKDPLLQMEKHLDSEFVKSVKRSSQQRVARVIDELRDKPGKDLSRFLKEVGI